MNHFLFCFFLLNLFNVCMNAQQNYSGDLALDCGNIDESGAPSDFLYTCNGQRRNCLAFLIYKAEPPFNSVPSISNLASTSQAAVATINNVTEDATFPTGKEVIIPVNCFCLGRYYQANTTFHISNVYGIYYTIATKAYQGLITCSSLKRANPLSEYGLVPGTELKVPLRCACPTRDQTKSGTKYLLTYSVNKEDTVPGISDRFNVSQKSINDANGLVEKQTIFPSTTILIPLPTAPSSSQTIIHKDQPLDSPQLFDKHPKSHRSKRKLYEEVGIAAACFVLVLIIILFFTFMFNKRKDGVLESSNERNNNYVLPAAKLRIEIARLDQGLRVFTFKEIKKATRNFSSKNRINGSVYSGGFRGKILAVKRMRRDVSKEIQLLKNINHFNLIKLQGVSENDGIFYLVFEYMKKGSLRDWLCNESSGETGSWIRRIQIALDVANGLYYLHSFTKPAYVHGDIKSSNVLLNNNLRAKIANFSLARAAVNEKSSIGYTSLISGTRGYIAREFIETGQVTSKIDVFAFGVVLLELITGKYAIVTQDRREVLLSETVVSIMEKDGAEAELDSFIDPRLKCDNWTEFALQMAQLSVACLTEEPRKRPSMEEVVSVLSKIQTNKY
ncbi:putative Calmodulin-like 41 [Hibiscus syriacus]|uniref:Calmodulin-like 41 n=1 Tax=Hibiscus syriacus TaxID=106335 RepID=A0A6A2Y3M3_HIBSY|nr:protein LYK5-like [Hibiscus syriacus]KAE8675285.1 putative Calmodulin-like 41 [Hibiscus syriacus]